ncbi:MAG: sulfide/dihydroorotate dehydrogenase-like FAD/NAD-binding protein [Clostridia bacterium]|nr:sulfide/dihydroorotate dehydrogenase-like FAD/NAD-binding protein [Clostridia bacterium]
MFKIVSKKILNPTVIQMEVLAPLVAKKAEAGQFIILRVNSDGERIPLTIAGYDREKGLVKIIFQVVGGTTELLKHKEVGDCLQDFVGPLGKMTDISNIKNAVVVGGGVGCAIALPLAKKLKQTGINTQSIIGFRSKDLVILEEDFKENSNNLIITTDDGTYGEKGNVCVPLERILNAGNKIDKIFAIGPLVMMKYVVLTAKKYNVPCIVSMNPIMIDGTGMCGCCRLSVDGQMKFACVDGPDFDGYEVDFDEMIQRNKIYAEFEGKAHEETCNLFKKEAR